MKLDPEFWPGWVDAHTLRFPWGCTAADGRLWDGFLDVTEGHPGWEQ